MDMSNVQNVQGGGDISATFDPLEMREALRPLIDPRTLSAAAPGLVAEWVKIAVGLSDVEIAERDPVYADPAWRTHPVFRRLAQSHRAWVQAVNRIIEDADTDGDWRNQARANYATNILTGAFAPANFLPTNPLAIRKAIDTGGVSVLRGVRNMLRDLKNNGGFPSMVDTRSFKVGETLACSPGAVVYREEMFEILQYSPTTAKVRKRPLLMIPPELNRHYVLDLAPEKSLVEFSVAQGVQTFCVVWRNPRPDPDLGHGKWGLDDYIGAHVRAFDVVRKITRSDTLNLLGLCGGGVTSAITQAYLTAIGDNPIEAATYLVTMLDAREPNMATMLDTCASRRLLSKQAEKGTIIKGKTVAHNFALMRPQDLVFNYVVNNWLLGEDPPAFDVLAWNDDATNMSTTFGNDVSELLADGKLTEPGGASVLGTTLDLSQVKNDSYFVIGERDHITTWRPCYLSSQIIGGENQVVVVDSGHIQSFVNAPGSSRYTYRSGPANTPDPDAWHAQAEENKGSWWPAWAEWLLARSGDEKKAPATLGNKVYPAQEPAPGIYVYEK